MVKSQVGKSWAKTTYEVYNSMFDIEKAYSSSRDDLSEEEEEKIKEYEQFREKC